MHSRPAPGEVGLASIFAITGVVWIAGAADLSLWGGFAPDSGFLPLVYGVLLLVLSGAAIATLFWGDSAPGIGPVAKPLLVLAAVMAAVVGLNVAGFSISIFLMLLFLYAVVEKLPPIRSLAAALGTTAALFLIFKTWLGVPLPTGPFGI
ncbi:MAG: tripartite tricarboxylate transporter TctB family protein [Xanthobacteraceae bacterium]